MTRSEISPMRRRLRAEHGDIITKHLMQLVLFMAVVGLLGYEALSVAFTGLSVDGDIEQVLDKAADTYDLRRDIELASEAAQLEADLRGDIVDEVTVDGPDITVTISKDANTVLLQRLGLFDALTHQTASRTKKWNR